MSQALINGIGIPYTDLRVTFLDSEMPGLKQLDFTPGKSKENDYGQGEYPVERLYGAKTFSGTIRLTLKEYNRFTAAALAAGYNDLLDIPMADLIVTFRKPQTRLAGIKAYRILAIDFTESPITGSSDTLGVYATLPFIAANIINVPF
jgi:hypothetical protein